MASDSSTLNSVKFLHPKKRGGLSDLPNDHVDVVGDDENVCSDEQE